MTADVVAATAQGRLRGARDGEALRFLGIPYAESPATAGRFAAPARPSRWDGIRDALAYGPACATLLGVPSARGLFRGAGCSLGLAVRAAPREAAIRTRRGPRRRRGG